MSISNAGTSPGFVSQREVVDTVTLSSVTPAPLSQSGIISYPAFEAEGSSPTSQVITVFDVTTSHALVLNTDYTLTPSGAGPTLAYSVTRMGSSSLSANGDTARVTYLIATAPDTEGPMGAPGTSPTGTQFEASETDTTGQGAAGLGSAMPGGSLTDKAMGTQSSSETGAPGSEYAVTQREPGTYGWGSGAPDTEEVYGPNLPENFAATNTSVTTTLDTTIGGGSNLVPSQGATPAYRAPSSGVAGSFKDTTWTDILGSQLNAQPTLDAAYAAVNVDTSYYGAPAQPTVLKTQTDTIPSMQNTTNYYTSQQGVVPSSLVVSEGGTTAVQGTDYNVTIQGAGPATILYIVRIGTSTVLTVGGSVSMSYAYGDATYWASNVPSSPPGTPSISGVTAVNEGVLVTWAPPAGQTEIDFYQILCSDGGTMYVPYTGQSVFDGQLAPSGGGEAGSPTFQSDTVSLTSSPASLSQSGILTPLGQLIVRDTVTGQVLMQGYDYTVTQTGMGPELTYSITRVASSQNTKSGDSVTVDYWWFTGTTISAIFHQGLLPNAAPIYKPSGATYGFQGYQFAVAAGNRRGMSAYSPWSAFTSPLNYNAPQPGHEGSTQTITALDPANTINPIYLPSGAVKSGTGLGG